MPTRSHTNATLDALTFQAPYVVERLLKNRVVDSAADGEELFDEAKKYLVLSAATRDANVGMYSVRVDEAWHAFLLYTEPYARFCNQYFGRYIHHAPTNAPDDQTHSPTGRPELTFSEFRDRYEALFCETLPGVWYNARNVTTARRMFNDAAGSVVAMRYGSVAELLDEEGLLILSASDIAYPAMDFISRTGAFHVRELPGGLTDEERIALVEALLSVGALRLAP